MIDLDERPLRYAESLSPWSSDAVRLRRQWVIGELPTVGREEWTRLTLRSGHTLAHHPDARLTVAEAGDVGIVSIGVLVTTDATSTLPEQLQRLARADEPTTVEILRCFAGMHVVVRHERDRLELFTDPAAMMQVFHRSDAAASTLPLLEPLARDHRLDRDFPFGFDNDWYPGSLTPFKGVRVLPANHVLSLPGATTKRFWPDRRPARLGAEEGTQQLAKVLRGIAHAALDLGPVLCSLTGGKDSRVNLAALGERADAVEFFTVSGPGVRPCDMRIPEQLTERLGLDHRFVSNRPAEAWVLELYDEMTHGLSIGGRRDVVGASALLAGPDYIHMNGNLGALAKSFFWHSKNPRTVRARSLAKELTNRPPAIAAAIADWLASVPELDATAVYNLMYLEQRGGRWMGIGETASQLFYDSLSPFCSREVFETICGMPTTTQYGGDLLIELVRELRPELREVGYCPARRNWSGHLPRGLKNRAKRVLARPSSR